MIFEAYFKHIKNIIDMFFLQKTGFKIIANPNYSGENNSTEPFPVMFKRLATPVEVALTTPSYCIKFP